MSFRAALACFTWSHLSDSQWPKTATAFPVWPISLVTWLTRYSPLYVFRREQQGHRKLCAGHLTSAFSHRNCARVSCLLSLSLSSRFAPCPRWRVSGASCRCCFDETAPASYLLPGWFTVHTGSWVAGIVWCWWWWWWWCIMGGTK